MLFAVFTKMFKCLSSITIKSFYMVCDVILKYIVYCVLHFNL